MSKSLTIVTCIFNPRRFRSRIQLYHQFVAYVRAAGCRLVTVEITLGDRPHEISGDDVIHLRTQCELWHKERALNIGIAHALSTEPATKYVAWIDADVTFSRPDWVAETVHALQHYHVVQMFGQAAYLNPDCEVLWTCPSAFKIFIDKGYHQCPPVQPHYIAKGHPGLAWACRAETWRNLEGLMDTAISGSGDTLMAWALRGRWDGYLPPDPLTDGYTAHLRKWARRCDIHVRENVGYVAGTCLHFWHGKSEQRGYDKRWQIISFHKFDPGRDLIEDDNGLWAWRPGHKPHLEHDLRLSSSQRNEDSITT